MPSNPPRPAPARPLLPAVLALIVAALAGCASTQVEWAGTAPPAPVCRAGEPPLPMRLQWRPRWRADQKEPERREAAVREGLQRFVAGAACLSVAAIERWDDDEVPVATPSTAPNAPARLWIEVTELGPVLKVGSPTVVEGGTEVRLRLVFHDPRRGPTVSRTEVHWRHGGPFVVRGVATLADDLADALVRSLLTAPSTR